LGPPLPLTDVFNYELYGRMAALHGLNPYRALPVAAANDPAFALANWHHLSSPYGPLFTLLSEALVPFGAHGWLWAWKLIVLVSGARHRPRAALGALLAGALTGVVMLTLYGGALPNLKTQGTLVTPLSVPNLLGLAAGHGGADPSVRSLARTAIVAIATAGT